MNKKKMREKIKLKAKEAVANFLQIAGRSAKELDSSTKIAEIDTYYMGQIELIMPLAQECGVKINKEWNMVWEFCMDSEVNTSK